MRLKDKLMPYTYQNLIKLYKKLLKEGNKKKLFFFRGLVYASLNHPECVGWRNTEDYLEEMCRLGLFEEYYRTYKKFNVIRWFDMSISEGAKKMLL